MIPRSLSKEQRVVLASVLKKMGVLPDLSCQITLHCAQGTVQALEYGKLIIK